MLILQTTVNISNLGLLISITVLVISLLGYIRLVRKDQLEKMDKKVDVSAYESFKIETTSRIGRKLDKEIFERFEGEVWRDIEAHKFSNDTGFKLLQETIKELQQTQTKQTEILGQMSNEMGKAATNIQWLVNERKLNH